MFFRIFVVYAALAAAAPSLATAEPFKLVGRGTRYQTLPNGMVNSLQLLKTLNHTLKKYNVGALGHHGDHAARILQRSTGKEPLSDQNSQSHDTEYYGNVQVGAIDPQTFSVDFDTGSADLFVPGPSCGEVQGCVGDTKYSQKGQKHGNTTSITYGSGQVTGENYLDTVCVVGLCAPHTNVISLTMATGFSSSESNSLMGMGFSTIANSKQPTFMENLIALKKVTANEFGFYLGRAKSNTQSKSELVLGGSDKSKYKVSTLKSHKVTKKGYWQLALDTVSVAGKKVVGSAGQAAIDTGTTIILAPTLSATAIFAQIPGAFPIPLASGSASTTLFAYPCATKSLPQLVFDGTSYAIDPLDFNLGKVTRSFPDLVGSGGSKVLKESLSHTRTCLAAIAGADINPISPIYVVGDSFLKSWYSIYNYDNGASVSFAKAV